MSMSRQAGIVLPGYNPLLVANAPTIGTATQDSPTSVSVPFTAPACTGGSVISTYSAYCTTTGTNRVTGASSPLVVTGLTTGTTYNFRVIATNIYGPSYPSAASNSVTPLPTCATFTSSGTFSWVAPAGVTSVSVVAVGAGGWGASGCNGGGGAGLGYINNYTVTPGSSYTVVVGARSFCAPSNGGDSHFVSTATVRGGGGQSNGTAGTFTGTGGGNGGTGFVAGAGAGGAGGYSGNGGNGASSNFSSGQSGSGGGGGGGGGRTGAGAGGGGGGVGIFGQGSSGAGGSPNQGGGGGSGGGAGGSVSGGLNTGGGGCFGGGSSAGTFITERRPAGGGVVRIVWPGNTRSFPSTNVGA